MTYIQFIDWMRELNIWSMMLRIVLATVCGGVVGFERERKGRAAGFRTYMLVAMGAALTVILSQYLTVMLAGDWYEQAQAVSAGTDITRFASQVINGVGFLGAGTVIVTGRQQVKGLTTAAGLWASACIGIAIGAGFYEAVLVSMLLLLLCMRLLPALEELMVANSRNMTVYIQMDSFENLSSIINSIKEKKIRIFEVEIEKEKGEHMSQFSVLFSVGLPRGLSHAELMAQLSAIDGITAIDEV